MTELRIQVIQSVSEIGAEDWEALAAKHNPFVGRSFLKRLKKAGRSPGAGMDTSLSCCANKRGTSGGIRSIVH